MALRPISLSPSSSISSVPIGQRGLVHIWGRNDTLVTQALGIHWVVTDPAGQVVEDYADWSYNHGPGHDHEFIGGRFDFDMQGTYRLKVDLLMNPDSPKKVATYNGVLCTVITEEPPPDGEEPPPEKDIWPTVAVVGAIGLGVAVAIAATQGKK